MKVAIIDYRMGNLGSVRRSFQELGAEVFVAHEPSEIERADFIVLPGVGAFSEGMKNLSSGGWIPALEDSVNLKHKPLLGICLGMQMLADYGTEGGKINGLGFIPGSVQKLDTLDCRERIPHVGWNEVSFIKEDILFENILNSSDFYFVHSYAFLPSNPKHLIATVPYGINLTAVVKYKQVYGCQFHPEKSSKVGKQFLSNFIKQAIC